MAARHTALTAAGLSTNPPSVDLSDPPFISLTPLDWSRPLAAADGRRVDEWNCIEVGMYEVRFEGDPAWHDYWFDGHPVYLRDNAALILSNIEDDA